MPQGFHRLFHPVKSTLYRIRADKLPETAKNPRRFTIPKKWRHLRMAKQRLNTEIFFR